MCKFRLANPPLNLHIVICTSDIFKPTHPNLHVVQIGKTIHKHTYTPYKFIRDTLHRVVLCSGLNCYTWGGGVYTWTCISNKETLLQVTTGSPWRCLTQSSYSQVKITQNTHTFQFDMPFWLIWLNFCLILDEWMFKGQSSGE